MIKSRAVTEPNGQRVAFYLGPWKVGAVYLNSLRLRGSTDNWTAVCYLPGISELGHFDSRESATKTLETVIQNWVSMIL